MAADDYSKHKRLTDMGEADIADWSQKKIRERQVAHGITPDPDDWSRKKMFDDSVGISPSTTTSSSTTTSTTTSSTATTVSTSTSTSSTTTTATLPFSLVVGDPPPPLTGPWAQQWVPTPAPPNFGNVDDGTLDVASEVDFNTAVGAAPLVDHLEIGPPSTPGGVYTAALVTLRMASVAPGGDAVQVDLFDSAGAPLALPGPHMFLNVGPGYENIQVLIPLVGPSPDPAIISGIIELTYIPGPQAPIDVADIRIEWL